MPNEPAIIEDDERPDDKTELRRLIRAVKFSQKHFLYFACCNQIPKQNELIAEIKKSLGAKKIKVIKFKKSITDLLGEIQKLKINPECEAIFVQGLEYSISSDGKGAENALIYNLNISRDSFKKYLSIPLFLWLPEYAIVKITRHAADFFSVRSGVFYFSNPPEKVTEQIFQSVSSDWVETFSLTVTEKLKQIEMLESLLAEYQGLHLEKQDKRAELELLSKLADIFYSISEYRKAIEYNARSLIIARQIGNRSSEGDCLGGLGLAYNSLGDHRKAIEYHEQNLAIAREVGSFMGEGNCLGNLGNAYRNLGDYQKANEYYEQSLAIARKTGDRHSESSSLNNLGLIYNSLADYQKAVEYYEQSLPILREINNRPSESASLNNLGNAYERLGDYQKALKYYKQSLTISRQIGDRQIEGAILGNLGNTYKNLGEKEKSCRLWKEALAIFEAIESPNADAAQQLIKENGC